MIYKVYLFTFNLSPNDLLIFKSELPNFHLGNSDSLFPYSFMREEELFYFKLKYPNCIRPVKLLDKEKCPVNIDSKETI